MSTFAFPPARMIDHDVSVAIQCQNNTLFICISAYFHSLMRQPCHSYESEEDLARTLVSSTCLLPEASNILLLLHQVDL